MSDLKHNIFTTVDHERTGTASEEVNLQLREMIHSGELRPGDRLPAERDKALDLEGLSVRSAQGRTGIAAADFSRIRNADLGRFTVG